MTQRDLICSRSLLSWRLAQRSDDLALTHNSQSLRSCGDLCVAEDWVFTHAAEINQLPEKEAMTSDRLTFQICLLRFLTDLSARSMEQVHLCFLALPFSNPLLLLSPLLPSPVLLRCCVISNTLSIFPRDCWLIAFCPS